jgi:hypothetical protein
VGNTCIATTSKRDVGNGFLACLPRAALDHARGASIRAPGGKPAGEPAHIHTAHATSRRRFNCSSAADLNLLKFHPLFVQRGAAVRM